MSISLYYAPDPCWIRGHSLFKDDLFLFHNEYWSFWQEDVNVLKCCLKAKPCQGLYFAKLAYIYARGKSQQKDFQSANLSKH